VIAVLRGHEAEVNSAVFSPAGSRIVTASWDRTARIWDAASGREIAVLRGHKDTVYSAAFSPDGSRIVTASSDGTARIWETMPAKGLLTEACARLAGVTKLTREEMRLAGYPDSMPEVDVCKE
jgi:WD40 repeat protein